MSGRADAPSFAEATARQASSPVFFVGPGQAVVQNLHSHPAPINEGARNAGAPTAPQPRVMCELDSHELITTVLPVPRRPARGVYRFAPRSPRWTYRFRRPVLRQARLSTAMRTDLCAGTSRLGPPMGLFAPNLRHPHRPPLPAPASDDADQTPLVDGTGWRLYNPSYGL